MPGMKYHDIGYYKYKQRAQRWVDDLRKAGHRVRLIKRRFYGPTMKGAWWVVQEWRAKPEQLIGIDKRK